jgi:membrane protein
VDTNGKAEKKEHPRSQILEFVREIYQIWVAERPTQLAAALAYFGLFSFAPVIYIAIAVAGIFIDKSTLLNNFLASLSTVLGPGVSQAVAEMLNKVSAPTSTGSILLSLVSFILLMLTASGVFFQLQYALNTIWKIPRSRKDLLQRTLRERLFSFVIVIGIGLLLVVGAMISVVTSWASTRALLARFLPTITFLGFIALASLSFGVMYKLLPSIKIAWRDVWAGAIIAASLVAVGGIVIIFFIDNTTISSALEAAGSFIILLTGFYYFAQIFLLGAIISRV